MSPLPWKAEYTKVVSDDMWIADFSLNPEVPAHIALTNTTFMVRAVNSHAELMVALECALEALRAIPAYPRLCAEIKTTLARAKGGQP